MSSGYKIGHSTSKGLAKTCWMCNSVFFFCAFHFAFFLTCLVERTGKINQ